MDIKTKTLLYFLVFCMGIRIYFVLLAKYLDKSYLPYMGYIAILIAIGFTTIYLTKSRDKGILGQKVWWDNLRPVHGLLYLIFGFLAINKNDYAWTVLLLDVILGFIAFTINHTTKQ